MTARTPHARGRSARIATAVEMQTLEMRRLLSGSYQLTNTLIDTDGGGAFQNFGQGIATNGNLALISSPGANSGGGKVELIDTSSGQLLQTFADAAAQPGTQFGVAVAFVDGKIAISEATPSGGTNKVFIYDNAADAVADRTYVSPYPNLTTFSLYGARLATYGDDLLVDVSQSPTSTNGEIFRYDLDSASPNAAQIITNVDPNATTNDQLGGDALDSDGTYIYASANVGGGKVVEVIDGAGNLVSSLSEPGLGSGFGFTIAAYNGTVFVGDPGAPGNSAGYPGAVYQFDAATGNLLRTITLPEGRVTFGGFGTGLAVSGNELFIGDQGNVTVTAFDQDNNPIEYYQSGAAYIYDIGTGDLVTTIENPDPNVAQDDAAIGGEFAGIAGGVTDGFLVVAAGADNANGTDAGTVYVYRDQTGPANTAPSNAVINGTAAGVRLQSLSFTGSFVDPDAGDTHTVSWDFGDGNVIGFHPTTDANALNVAHAYAASGNYTVTMIIKDAAGATASATFAVAITATGVQGQNLYVGGSNGVDSISVTKDGNGNLVVSVGATTTTYNGAGQIVILAGDGNDVISIGSSVTTGVFISAGAGSDSVHAGAGNDIIVGGGGNDTIYGMQGRDLLIGGGGSDVIVGYADDDILVGGTTSYDGDTAALGQVLAEWTSNHSYADRVANIKNGSGVAARLNGNIFITPDVTAFDDDASDTLSGLSGQDLFVFNADGVNADVITDLKTAETSLDVDLLA